MMYVIVCRGMVGRTLAVEDAPLTPVGEFLESYEPEAHQGMGYATWTRELPQAMKFNTKRAAWATWEAVPRNKPVRHDGKPNRPLTAFTVEIAPESDYEE